ncbi:MAG: TonB-dependent receptor [Acidobacteria bacterium]|nr:TonB-dependent receptor [Acidobacteriota bacterium]
MLRTKGLGEKIWLVFVVVALVSMVGRAQTTGGIEGVVRDETGAVLPGVTVTVTQVGTGLKRVLVTDETGRYSAPQLPVGEYTIQSELPGFKKEVRTGVVVTVARVLVVNMTLPVGEMTEQVVVTGEAPLVETAKSDLAGLTNDRQMRALPLNLRSFERLATLHPGVLSTRFVSDFMNEGTTLKFSVSGGRTTFNSFVLDGTVIDDITGGSPGGAGGALPGVEAIREFRVLTHNYAAEYGRRAGAVITSVSRSGTNEIHGSVYEFHRNDNVDARNFFDAGENPPEFKRNQFGAAVGGPIRKDKAFFFGNYEGLREALGLTLRGFVPTDAAREGRLPGRTIIINPTVRSYLALYPRVNGRDFGDGTGEHIFTFSRTVRDDFFTTKVDHNFTDRRTLGVRYTFQDSEKLDPRPLPGFAQVTTFRNQWVTLEEKEILSSSALNVFRFGFTRTTPRIDALSPEFDPSLSFIPGQGLGDIRTSESTGALPGSETGALSELGPDFAGSGVLYGQQNFQFSDDFSYTKGAHSLKAGIHMERLQYNLDRGLRKEGIYAFSGLEELLRGTAAAFSGLDPRSDPNFRFRQSFWAFFLQDDYKVKRNLTLNLGIRYEFVTEPTEKAGGVIDSIVADLVRPRGLQSVKEKLPNHILPTDAEVTVGKPLFNSDLKNWAPRLGIAWDPFSDGKTSVRAGFGIFYNQLLGRDWAGFTPRTLPFVRNLQVQRPPFPGVFSAILGGGGTPSFDTFGMNPNWKTPALLHYSLSLQRELFRDLVVDVGYVGSTGYHLVRQFEQNRRIHTVLPDGRKFFDARTPKINPRFAEIDRLDSDLTSDYHSLQWSVEQRLRHGVEFKASYTLGKSLDQGSQVERLDALNGPRTVLDPDDRRRDNGPSTFDVRHNFVLNYSVDLPFGRGRPFLSGLSPVADRILGGWQFTGLLALSSGQPFNAEVGFGRSNDGIFRPVDRPDLLPGRSNNPVLGSPDKWFDPTGFAMPQEGTYGNLGRNTLVGPGLAELDFSIIKNTPLDETRAIQFRAEFFNLTNRANFGSPQSILFNRRGEFLGNVGKITSTTTTSRQIQFALKFIF